MAVGTVRCTSSWLPVRLGRGERLSSRIPTASYRHQSSVESCIPSPRTNEDPSHTQKEIQPFRLLDEGGIAVWTTARRACSGADIRLHLVLANHIENSCSDSGIRVSSSSTGTNRRSRFLDPGVPCPFQRHPVRCFLLPDSLFASAFSVCLADVHLSRVSLPFASCSTVVYLYCCLLFSSSLFPITLVVRSVVGPLLCGRRSFQPLPLPPVRMARSEGGRTRCVVVFDEVAEFVGDDVVDAGWACLDQLQVQQDAAFFGATAPAAFHEADAPTRWGKASKARRRQAMQAGSNVSMLAVRIPEASRPRNCAVGGDFKNDRQVHTALALRNPKAGCRRASHSLPSFVSVPSCYLPLPHRYCSVVSRRYRRVLRDSCLPLPGPPPRPLWSLRPPSPLWVAPPCVRSGFHRVPRHYHPAIVVGPVAWLHLVRDFESIPHTEGFAGWLAGNTAHRAERHLLSRHPSRAASASRCSHARCAFIHRPTFGGPCPGRRGVLPYLLGAWSAFLWRSEAGTRGRLGRDALGLVAPSSL